MCRFKSGIILKTRCVIAQGADDSHSAILEVLGIKDTAENAMTKFVRAELLPPDDEWWTNPDTWKAHIDQDILPEWFETDREKYIDDFQSAVKDWWETHVLVDQKIDVLSSGYYRLKRCQVKKLMNDVQVMLDSSTVQEMYDSSIVQEMYDSSTVQRMLGRSTVQRMLDISTVQRMLDISTVQEMYDSSTVQRMLGRSTVQEMLGSSTVQRMYGSSIVQVMYDSSTVQRMLGSSTVQRMLDSSTVQVMLDSSVIARDQNNDIHTAKKSQSKIVRHNNVE